MARIHCRTAASFFVKALRKARSIFAKRNRRRPAPGSVIAADLSETPKGALLSKNSATETELVPLTESREDGRAENPADRLKEELEEVYREFQAARKELAATTALLDAEKERLRQTEAARVDAEFAQQVSEADFEFLQQQNADAAVTREAVRAQLSALERQIFEKKKELYGLEHKVEEYEDRAEACNLEALQQQEKAAAEAARLDDLNKRTLEAIIELEQVEKSYNRTKDYLDLTRKEYELATQQMNEKQKQLAELNAELHRLQQALEKDREAERILNEKTAESQRLKTANAQYDQTSKELLEEKAALDKNMELDGTQQTEDVPQDTLPIEAHAALRWREALELISDLGRSTAYHRCFMELMVKRVGEIVDGPTAHVCCDCPLFEELADRINYLRAAYGTEQPKENALHRELQVIDERAKELEGIAKLMVAKEAPAVQTAKNETPPHLNERGWGRKLRAKLGFETSVWDGMACRVCAPWIPRSGFYIGDLIEGGHSGVHHVSGSSCVCFGVDEDESLGSSGSSVDSLL